jgi:hypothetical protein
MRNTCCAAPFAVSNNELFSSPRRSEPERSPAKGFEPPAEKCEAKGRNGLLRKEEQETTLLAGAEWCFYSDNSG